MSYIDTFTQKRISPFDPDVNQICIEDIAHALSMLCRFGGHCTSFYSVAEHSVHVSNVVEPRYALWGLLHDATEAYIGDVVRPIKKLSDMSAYRQAEERLFRAIAHRFGLEEEMPTEVKLADSTMLQTEKSQVLTGADLTKSKLPVLDMQLKLLLPTEAEQLFLTRFNELFA